MRDIAEWQPTETAPKDGTPVIIWSAEARIPSVGWHHRGKWWTLISLHDGGCGRALIPEPTYWMPLPPPPDNGDAD